LPQALVARFEPWVIGTQKEAKKLEVRKKMHILGELFTFLWHFTPVKRNIDKEVPEFLSLKVQRTQKTIPQV
jgi:hypothetical protein